MKLSINPKNLFRGKKTRSISRSDPPSFSSSDGSSSSTSNKGKETPTTVLKVKEAEVVEVFKMMDKDGDGKITMEELEAVLRTVGGAHPPSTEELAVMLSELDQDGDGCISLDEFTAVSSAFGPPSSDSELLDTFNIFDADHDGRITAEELYLVFSALGDEGCTLEQCQGMISGIDINGDGSVCFDEFALMMKQQR